MKSLIVILTVATLCLTNIITCMVAGGLKEDRDFWKESAKIQRVKVVELEYRLKLWETL